MPELIKIMQSTYHFPDSILLSSGLQTPGRSFQLYPNPRLLKSIDNHVHKFHHFFPVEPKSKTKKRGLEGFYLQQVNAWGPGVLLP